MSSEHRPPTDLEAAALGAIAVHQPCTAHQIRRMFLDAPSARFSGSAGAVYPMIRRLESAGLVRAQDAPTGDRPARVYSITDAGRAALVRWIGDLTPSSSFADDPLRTRVIYLRQLPPAERSHWLDEAERSLRAQTEIIQRHAAADRDDPWMTLAHENALALNEARRDWLRRVRERIEQM